MFRLLFRLAGILALAAAFVAVIIDGTRSLAANEVVMARLGEHLLQILGPRYAALQSSAERLLGPKAWDIVVVWIFAAPTAAILAIVGIVLVLLTGKRREPIGFAARP